MKKSVIALLILMLLAAMLAVPVSAAEPEEPPAETSVESFEDDSTDPYSYLNEEYYTFVSTYRLKYISSGGVGLSFSGTTASFSGNCGGSSSALYKVSVYLLRLDDSVAAGPFSNGPATTAYASGSRTGCSGSYYARAYCYAYVNGTLVESTYVDSDVKAP